MNQIESADSKEVDLAIQLFGVFNGTLESNKTIHEWTTLYDFQREQWLATAKFVMTKFNRIDNNVVFTVF